MYPAEDRIHNSGSCRLIIIYIIVFSTKKILNV
nr:MAG TPA: hypothetical protein [Bacteriophage sp.]DAT75564.1 MAG TPA: hypothetical protein [Crassvirales sp.]